jgi:energy-coupling factor transporter transmembrane protein EcfT
VIGFLRFLGILNVGVWLGAAIFFTFGAGPAIFSQDVQQALQGVKNPQYSSGIIAQIIIARYFRLQMICCCVALIHVLAEWLYCGRAPRRFWLGLLIALILAGLVGDFWLQPKLKKLHTIKYSAAESQQTREAAGQSFGAWHGVSQSVNLLMLIGLATYLWRLTNPPEEGRFHSSGRLIG